MNSVSDSTQGTTWQRGMMIWCSCVCILFGYCTHFYVVCVFTHLNVHCTGPLSVYNFLTLQSPASCLDPPLWTVFCCDPRESKLTQWESQFGRMPTKSLVFFFRIFMTRLVPKNPLNTEIRTKSGAGYFFIKMPFQRIQEPLKALMFLSMTIGFIINSTTYFWF